MGVGGDRKVGEGEGIGKNFKNGVGNIGYKTMLRLITLQNKGVKLTAKTMFHRKIPILLLIILV